MKRVYVMTCPRLTLRWLLFSLIYLAIFLTFFALIDFIVGGIVLFAGATVIAVIELSVKLKRSLFKCFIINKIDKDGISNIFCRIKWSEIEFVDSDRIEISFNKFFGGTRSIKRFFSGDYGNVLILKKSNEKEQTYKNYLVKNAVCIPYNNKTRLAISNFCPDEYKGRIYQGKIKN